MIKLSAEYPKNFLSSQLQHLVSYDESKNKYSVLDTDCFRKWAEDYSNICTIWDEVYPVITLTSNHRGRQWVVFKVNCGTDQYNISIRGPLKDCLIDLQSYMSANFDLESNDTFTENPERYVLYRCLLMIHHEVFGYESGLSKYLKK